MSKLNRRNFLRQTAIAGGAALALEGLFARDELSFVGGGGARAAGSGGYGPLSARASNNTGELLLRLPEGFQYTVFGKVGSPMSDGRLTPGAHDGMAAYDINGMIHLVRNHEEQGGTANSVAPGSLPYDPKATGGTATLIVDPVTRLLVYDFISLSGTVRNLRGRRNAVGFVADLRGDDRSPCLE